MNPVIFAPGIVSTVMSEFSCTFSPDGKSFYFARDIGGYKYNIYITRETENGWTNPQVAPFSGKYLDHEPFCSHDGRRLFWGSIRPLNDGKIAYSTWFIEKTDEDWGEPQPLNFFAMYVTSSTIEPCSIRLGEKADHALQNPDLWTVHIKNKKSLVHQFYQNTGTPIP